MQNELISDQLNLEIVSTIAAGGMGVVYEALQHGVGDFRKAVALKLIREEYSAIDEFKDNFMGEAKLVADLIHTNIVQTYHLGEMSGQYFMTMEFINGINLEEFIDLHIKTTGTYLLTLRCLLYLEFAEDSPTLTRNVTAMDNSLVLYTAM